MDIEQKVRVEDMEERRFCKKCLIRDLAVEEQKDLQKYIDVIKKQDRVSDELYEKRLNICRECDKLLDATCEACGCYVEYRAIIKHGKCPYKKW